MKSKNAEILIPRYQLFLSYDGVEYLALHQNHRNYYVGDVLSELGRAVDSIDRMIKMIINVKNYYEPATTEGLLEALEQIDSMYCDAFGVASGALLLANYASTLRNLISGRIYEDIDKLKGEYSVTLRDKKQILRSMGISETGIKTVGQVLASGFILESGIIKKLNKLISLIWTPLTDECDTDIKDSFLAHALFENHDLIQSTHIDYRIMNIEDKLTNVFAFTDAFSLLMFEVANCVNNNVRWKKCKHCGKFFALHGRSDTEYCSFSDGNMDGKTCKEIGAQTTRAEKLKNDVAANEYRKLYLRIKMQVRRHSEDGRLQDLLDTFMAEGKEYRKKLDANEITEDDYLEWLNKIEKKYKRKK